MSLSSSQQAKQDENSVLQLILCMLVVFLAFHVVSTCSLETGTATIKSSLTTITPTMTAATMTTREEYIPPRHDVENGENNYNCDCLVVLNNFKATLKCSNSSFTQDVATKCKSSFNKGKLNRQNQKDQDGKQDSRKFLSIFVMGSAVIFLDIVALIFLKHGREQDKNNNSNFEDNIV